MPTIGDTVRAAKIGLKGGHKYIWVACPCCNSERWVAEHSLCRSSRKKDRAKDGRDLTGICKDCSGKFRAELSNCWKGGRTENGAGYIWLKLQPDDFFYPMANKNNYVLEHRLVMAKHLGRCLHRCFAITRQIGRAHV